MFMPANPVVTRDIRCRRATVSAVFDNTLLIQFLQHQHGDPRISSGDDPLHPGFVSVPVVDHGSKARAPIVPVDQLELVGRMSCGCNGFINHPHCLVLPKAVQVDFYKCLTQIDSPPRLSKSRYRSIRSRNASRLKYPLSFAATRPSTYAITVGAEKIPIWEQSSR